MNPEEHKQFEDFIRWMRAAVKVLGLVVFVLLACVIALQLQLQKRNHQLDDIEHAVSEVKTAANDAEAAATKADNDLTAAIAASQSASGGTARAIAVIFEIEQILCEVFPGAEVCEQGG